MPSAVTRLRHVQCPECGVRVRHQDGTEIGRLSAIRGRVARMSDVATGRTSTGSRRMMVTPAIGGDGMFVTSFGRRASNFFASSVVLIRAACARRSSGIRAMKVSFCADCIAMSERFGRLPCTGAAIASPRVVVAVRRREMMSGSAACVLCVSVGTGKRAGDAARFCLRARSVCLSARAGRSIQFHDAKASGTTIAVVTAISDATSIVGWKCSSACVTGTPYM